MGWGSRLLQKFPEEAAASGLYGTAVSIISKFGQNPDVDGEEDIWGGGGLYTGTPTGSAETIEVFSSDANDTAAGTGARTVRLLGLDSNFNEITEDVTLNGTTPVETTQLFTRCPRQYVLTAGSGGTSAGSITMRHSTTTTNVFSVMQAGRNQSTIACYTIPDGHVGLVRRLAFRIHRESGGTASREANVDFLLRTEGGVWRAQHTETISNDAPINERLYGGIILPARSDFKAHVYSVTTSNSIMSANFAIGIYKLT